MSAQHFCHALLCLLVWIPFSACAAADGLAGQLRRQMEVNQQRYGIVGQAVHVTHNGRTLFSGVAGQVDVESGRRVAPDDIFPAYSLSKLFASTLVMQLVEQGKVDLDRAASAYLPALPQRWHAITLRQLLNHTSGLPEYFTPAQMAGTAAANASFQASLPAVFSVLADKPLAFAPGSDTRYTQTNYLVLLQLLEAQYGRPYADIAAERIIRKLRLTHTWLGHEGLPRQGVVTAYAGKDGELLKEPDIAWPRYAQGHADLYTSIGDLGTFLRAMAAGELVAKTTLQQLWQPQTLTGGRRGGFATGWEYGESGAYRQAGHDGGARVRARILFKGSLDGDVYTIAYLASGSRRNVWSRTLVDSVMATVAPEKFPGQALAERLTGFALQKPDEAALRQFAAALRTDSSVGESLEAVINNSGYAIRTNLGVDTALPVFILNTELFPTSANTWDSLAEAYEAKGDTAKAAAARSKMKESSGAPP